MRSSILNVRRETVSQLDTGPHPELTAPDKIPAGEFSPLPFVTVDSANVTVTPENWRAVIRADKHGGPERVSLTIARAKSVIRAGGLTALDAHLPDPNCARLPIAGLPSGVPIIAALIGAELGTALLALEYAESGVLVSSIDATALILRHRFVRHGRAAITLALTLPQSTRDTAARHLYGLRPALFLAPPVSAPVAPETPIVDIPFVACADPSPASPDALDAFPEIASDDATLPITESELAAIPALAETQPIDPPVQPNRASRRNRKSFR